MDTLNQILAAQSAFKRAAINLLASCSALKAAAGQSFSLISNQAAYENLMDSTQDNLGYIDAIEMRVHESRVALNGLLNASPTRVPINKLPPEILGYIFSIIVASSCFDTGSQCDTLLNIPRVCARWRQVAINTPSLWSHIDINLLSRPETDWLGGARVRVNRCRNLPIHLYLEGSSSVPQEVVSNLVSLLQPHAASLGSLTISTTVAYPLINALYGLLSSGTSSSLKNLVMSHIYWDGNPENALRWPIDSLHGTVELDLFCLETGICPTSDEMVAILSNCPALQTLRLGDLEFIPGRSEEFPTIFLPSLKLLEIADVRGDGLPQLLSLISPGVLELDVRLDSLYIGNNRIASPTHLLLARSNVASLSIDACSPGQVGQYSLYLPVLPRLRTLFLGGLHAEEVMAALSDSTLQLPHLKSLCFFATVMFDGVVHSLERVIAARKLHRLVFVSCAFSGAFDRAEGNARVNHGKLCYSMPADMMEWLSEQVGKVVVHNEPWNELYQGMLVQELIRLD